MDATELETAVRSASRFRSILATSTLVMMLLSAPLWMDSSEFPRVPFVKGYPTFPPYVSIVGFVILGVSLFAAAVDYKPRAAMLAGASATFVLVIGDQHRLQPWVYQYFWAAWAFGTCREVRAARLCRWYLVSVYVYSGLSKLDVSFARELGGVFLETGVGLFGFSTAAWPRKAVTAAILAMPLVEIAVGAGFASRTWRPVARGGAIVLHAMLILILGPLGLNHSTIVQVWNAALIAQTWVLFSSSLDAPILGKATTPERLAIVIHVFIILMPLTERWGLFDAWPSHALYSSHCERTEVLVPTESLDALPASIRAFAGESDEFGRSRIDLTAWSRSVRGVPLYPQARACHGLAEYLSERYRGARPIRVIHHRSASFWSGSRRATILDGREAIRREAERYWLNARPSGGLARFDRSSAQ